MPGICDRQPDSTVDLGDGVTKHSYRKTPNADAPQLIQCHVNDPGYWKNEVSADPDDPNTCTVMIFYRAPMAIAVALTESTNLVCKSCGEEFEYVPEATDGTFIAQRRDYVYATCPHCGKQDRYDIKK